MGDRVKSGSVSAAVMSAVAVLVGVTGAHASGGGQTQLQMNENAATAAREADRALNAAYAKLEPTPELKTAERAWISFRDAECKYEAAVYAGGTLQPMTYSLCIERLTKSRAREFLDLSKFEEYKRH